MKLFTSALLVLLSSAVAFGQSGKVLEHQVLKSKTLAKDVHYTIYLPPDYDLSTRRYPVVYLLHGYTDDDRAWVQFGEANRYADKAINSGEIPSNDHHHARRRCKLVCEQF